MIGHPIHGQCHTTYKYDYMPRSPDDTLRSNHKLAFINHHTPRRNAHLTRWIHHPKRYLHDMARPMGHAARTIPNLPIVFVIHHAIY